MPDSGDVRRAWQALRRSGALKAPVFLELTRLLAAVRRFGPSFYALAAWQARRQPQAVALTDSGGTLTYGELQAQADDWAGRLPAASGQRVALLCRSDAAFVVGLLACARAGVRTLLLNPTLPAAQVTELCQAQGVNLLLASPEYLEPLRGREDLRCLSFAEWPHLPPHGRPPVPGRAGLEFLTSGTTGTPKVVRRPLVQPFMLRLGAHLLNTLGLRAGSPTLLTLPLYHGHGLTTLGVSLALGAPLHLAAHTPAPELWRILQERGIEVLVLVPTILHRLLAEPQATPPTLRTIVSGSGPLGAELSVRALKHFGPVLFNLYGTSETGLMTLATPHDLKEAPGTVGSPLPGVYIRIKPVPDMGQVGVIQYANADHHDPEDQFSTGDLGYFDDLGRLHLLGRVDDVVVRGGVNLDPTALERELMQSGWVQDCAVIGEADPEYGQVIHAFVVLQPGTSPEAAQEQAAQLPRLLRPDRITVLDTLPRNEVGKVMRRALPALANLTLPRRTG